MKKSLHLGFTLMEVLVSISIIVIVTVISLPSAKSFFNRANDQVLQSQILNAIELAGQEARARHVAVALCQSDNKINCEHTAQKYLLVFVNEEDGNNVQEDELLLTVIRMKLQRGKLHMRSYPYYREHISFNPSTLVHQDNATFWFCQDSQSSPNWAIMLSDTGKARVKQPNKNGVIRDSHGKLLGCESA